MPPRRNSFSHWSGASTPTGFYNGNNTPASSSAGLNLNLGTNMGYVPGLGVSGVIGDGEYS
jgi:hypothetical protein